MLNEHEQHVFNSKRDSQRSSALQRDKKKNEATGAEHPCKHIVTKRVTGTKQHR